MLGEEKFLRRLSKFLKRDPHSPVEHFDLRHPSNSTEDYTRNWLIIFNGVYKNNTVLDLLPMLKIIYFSLN